MSDQRGDQYLHADHSDPEAWWKWLLLLLLQLIVTAACASARALNAEAFANTGDGFYSIRGGWGDFGNPVTGSRAHSVHKYRNRRLAKTIVVAGLMKSRKKKRPHSINIPSRAPCWMSPWSIPFMRLFALFLFVLFVANVPNVYRPRYRGW